MPHSDHSPSPPPSSFANLPPFPDNVPTAPLLRISLQKLLNGDADEEERCWNACRELGFFYLDLRADGGSTQGTSQAEGIGNASLDGEGISHREGIANMSLGEALLSDADQLFEVMKRFFDLSVEEKVKFDFKDKGSYFGYKGYGAGIVDGKGTRDRNEFYNVRCPVTSFGERREERGERREERGERREERGGRE